MCFEMHVLFLHLFAALGYFSDCWNAVGNTTDEELERKNFEHPMKALVEVWDNGRRDGHPVRASYTMEESKHAGAEGPTNAQIAAHVRYARACETPAAPQ